MDKTWPKLHFHAIIRTWVPRDGLVLLPPVAVRWTLGMNWAAWLCRKCTVWLKWLCPACGSGSAVMLCLCRVCCEKSWQHLCRTPRLLEHVHYEVVHLVEHNKVHGQTRAPVLSRWVTGQPWEGVVLFQHKSMKTTNVLEILHSLKNVDSSSKNDNYFIKYTSSCHSKHIRLAFIFKTYFRSMYLNCISNFHSFGCHNFTIN